SDFFHGLKFPPFGDVGPLEAVRAPLTSSDGFQPLAEPQRQRPEAVAALPNYQRQGAATSPARNARKIFLATTYALHEDSLAANAVDCKIDPGIEKFVPLETIREALPAYVEHFKRITHIDSMMFFYPCAKTDQRVIIPPARHGDFVSHLVGKVLEKVASREGVDLHLILHAGDEGGRRPVNTKETSSPLIERLLRDHAGKIADVTIWWCSHNDRGIHGVILVDKGLFAGVHDKADCLLHHLAMQTGTLPPETGSGERVPSHARIQATATFHLEFRIPVNCRLTSRDSLDRLAVWQLNGSDNLDALEGIFVNSGEGSGFWNVRYSPENCNGRLMRPRPLLLIGSRTLDVFAAKDLRANYLDSSIWCRYAANEQEAADIRKQFERNRELGLYDCNNGKEYLEFWARMLVNSQIGEFEGSGHNQIAPIVFHSEGEMVEKTKRIADLLSTASHHPLTWKILLVDDHANENLTSGRCSKLDVICKVLAPQFSIELCDGSKTVSSVSGSDADNPSLKKLGRLKICIAESKEEAKACIKRERFDIILLDYLLNRKGSTLETSDELLTELKDVVPDFKEAYGPFNQLWLSNISAFAYAIDGKMTAKGLAYVRPERWRMDKGACPINTPELFRHNLIQFMLNQVRHLSFFSDVEWLKRSNAPRMLADLLTTIYRPEKGKVRESAKTNFHALLHFKKEYDVLRKDIEYGLVKDADSRIPPEKLATNPYKSEIVYSLFPDIAHYDDAFWDHLIHLVYYTAYGSPQQWLSMLVNFKEMKERLWQAAGDNKEGVDALLRAIEGYIITMHDSGKDVR
ncbi:MAG: hypothetical protein FWF12_09800, partial [Betaproteobacteria bacterium]|nr:hypothetical protein [Betaproteobacteria bacterium]